MKKTYRFVCLAFALAPLCLVVAPASAQRYCQRELNDDDAVDQGCTAPVGGPITKSDPRYSIASSRSDAAEQNGDVDVDALIATVDGE